MTPKTFWTIFLKIIGIYLILNSLTLIPQFISSFAFSYGQDFTFGLIMIFFAILILTIIYFLILRYCIFKTDWIINKLKLSDGFSDDKIELKIHRSTVLSISIIVIGGIVFIDSLPQLCKESYQYFQQHSTSMNPSAGWLIFYFIKTIIGILLMSYHRMIVNFIERKRKKEVNGL
jgi:hypothetical protein